MHYAKSLRAVLGDAEAEKWKRLALESQPKVQHPKSVNPIWQSSATFLSCHPCQKPMICDRVLIVLWPWSDRVHGVSDNAPSIPLRQTSGARTLGVYRHNWNGTPADIGASRNGDHPELTLAHEIGHYLDHQLLDHPGRYASQTSVKLDAWRQATRNSEAVRSLENALATGK